MSYASDAVRAAAGEGRKGLVRTRRPKSRKLTDTVAKPSLWRPKLSDCVDLIGGGGDLRGGTKAKILAVLLLLCTIGFAADPSTTHHGRRVVSERRFRRSQSQHLQLQQVQHHLSHNPRDFNVTQSKWTLALGLLAADPNNVFSFLSKRFLSQGGITQLRFELKA